MLPRKDQAVTVRPSERSPPRTIPPDLLPAPPYLSSKPTSLPGEVRVSSSRHSIAILSSFFMSSSFARIPALNCPRTFARQLPVHIREPHRNNLKTRVHNQFFCPRSKLRKKELPTRMAAIAIRRNDTYLSPDRAGYD